jgi:hypothetical protein
MAFSTTIIYILKWQEFIISIRIRSYSIIICWSFLNVLLHLYYKKISYYYNLSFYVQQHEMYEKYPWYQYTVNCREFYFVTLRYLWRYSFSILLRYCITLHNIFATLRFGYKFLKRKKCIVPSGTAALAGVSYANLLEVPQNAIYSDILHI